MIDVQSRIRPNRIGESEYMDLKKFFQSRTWQILATICHNRATIEAIQGNLDVAEVYESLSEINWERFDQFTSTRRMDSVEIVRDDHLTMVVHNGAANGSQPRTP